MTVFALHSALTASVSVIQEATSTLGWRGLAVLPLIPLSLGIQGALLTFGAYSALMSVTDGATVYPVRGSLIARRLSWDGQWSPDRMFAGLFVMIWAAVTVRHATRYCLSRFAWRRMRDASADPAAASLGSVATLPVLSCFATVTWAALAVTKYASGTRSF